MANFDSSLAAYCLVYGYGELYIDVLLVQVLDGEGYDCIFYVVLDLCWLTVLLDISQYILKQTQQPRTNNYFIIHLHIHICYYLAC